MYCNSMAVVELQIYRFLWSIWSIIIVLASRQRLTSEFDVKTTINLVEMTCRSAAGWPGRDQRTANNKDRTSRMASLGGPDVVPYCRSSSGSRQRSERQCCLKSNSVQILYHKDFAYRWSSSQTIYLNFCCCFVMSARHYTLFRIKVPFSFTT